MIADDSLKTRLNIQHEIDALRKGIAKHEVLLDTRLLYERETLERHADELRRMQSEVSVIIGVL